MIKKLVKWTFVVLLTLILGLTSAIYIFKDRIIQQVIVEVNNYMAVPVEVSKVDIDFFHGFPRVSVAFYNVSLIAENESILDAQKIYTLINPFELASGKLDFEVLEIIDADLNVYIDKNNKSNLLKLFNSTSQSSDDTSDTTETAFSLKAITMKNVNLNYINKFSGGEISLVIDELKGGINLSEGMISSGISSKLSLNKLTLRDWSSPMHRKLELDLDISYDIETKHLHVAKSAVKLDGAQAALEGDIDFLNQVTMNLDLKTDNLSFNLLSSFLPERFQSILKKYNGTGSINFDAEINGAVTSRKLPALKAKLELSSVNLKAINYDAHISDLAFMANLSIANLADLSSATLTIDQAQGLLQDKSFNFNFSLKNLLKPVYNGKFKGDVGIDWILAMADYPDYNTAQGQIKVNLDIASVTEDNFPAVDGVFTLEDISFDWSDSIRINGMSGQVLFSEKSIELANLKFNWLDSDLNINGQVEDLMYNLSQPNRQVVLKSDVRANYLAVEDIVTLIRETPDFLKSKPADSTAINPVANKIDLDLVAKFDQLKFQRYHGKNVAGEILFQDKVLEITDLTSKGLGGNMRLNGALKIMPNEEIFIQATAVTRGVYLDSLFYTFKNFNQEFIVDENLNGRLFSDISASMYFKPNWEFKSNYLIADAKIGIVEGELNDFEPIMALSSYIDDKEDNLSRLRFSDLVNTIRIRNDTIYIPEMSIRTNVRNIALGGYHTLRQHINYQLAVPIINERVDKDEAFGAVQKSSKGSPNLLFRIKGTTTDYKVNYDLLRATGSVLKLLDITKIFKKDEKIPVDSTFLNDEEFDW
jgi:hypothetical protein